MVVETSEHREPSPGLCRRILTTHRKVALHVMTHWVVRSLKAEGTPEGLLGKPNSAKLPCLYILTGSEKMLWLVKVHSRFAFECCFLGWVMWG